MQLVLKSTEICNVRYVLESCINIYIGRYLEFMHVNTVFSID